MDALKHDKVYQQSKGISQVADESTLRIGGQATAYVCENFACQTPLKSAAELDKTLKALNNQRI